MLLRVVFVVLYTILTLHSDGKSAKEIIYGNLEWRSYDKSNYENKINNISALFYWNILILLSSHMWSL